ncbi:unnamed protein product, partial [Rotaria sp. Silwood2]
MEALHTFTFVKSFKWHYREEWTFVDIDGNRSHSELRKYIPFGSQSHSRQIDSATFIAESWPDNQSLTTPGEDY